MKAHHYARLMRLDKPIGIYLLLWPTLIALWCAGNGQPDGRLIVIFVLGVVIMRSAGCVINDFADRKIDGLVVRTNQRPLITGDVTVIEALVLFVALSLCALILVFFTNPDTVRLAVVALILAAVYPFTKRFTYFPQVFLGAAFAWAIPMAYMAQTQTLPLTCWLLFVATLIWALAYDTLYAMADREEDKKAGIKSIAIFLGDYDKWVVGLSHAIVLLVMACIGYLQEFNGFFYMGLFCASLLALYQQWQVRNREASACFQAFLDNHWFGMILFIACAWG